MHENEQCQQLKKKSCKIVIVCFTKRGIAPVVTFKHKGVMSNTMSTVAVTTSEKMEYKRNKICV